jgi:hypothetical protein
MAHRPVRAEAHPVRRCGRWSHQSSAAAVVRTCARPRLRALRMHVGGLVSHRVARMHALAHAMGIVRIGSDRENGREWLPSAARRDTPSAPCSCAELEARVRHWCESDRGSTVRCLPSAVRSALQAEPTMHGLGCGCDATRGCVHARSARQGVRAPRHRISVRV